MVETLLLMAQICLLVRLISAVGREIRGPLLIEGGSTLLGFIGLDKQIEHVKCERLESDEVVSVRIETVLKSLDRGGG